MSHIQIQILTDMQATAQAEVAAIAGLRDQLMGMLQAAREAPAERGAGSLTPPEVPRDQGSLPPDVPRDQGSLPLELLRGQGSLPPDLPRGQGSLEPLELASQDDLDAATAACIAQLQARGWSWALLACTRTLPCRELDCALEDISVTRDCMWGM